MRSALSVSKAPMIYSTLVLPTLSYVFDDSGPLGSCGLEVTAAMAAWAADNAVGLATCARLPDGLLSDDHP